jgi:hypothetical protein
MNHFTNKEGFDGIRSQPTWSFRASQPRAAHNPVGAYFTDYPPDEHNLAVKLFLPREKLHYIFAFSDRGNLLPLPGGRGRLKRIFYSPVTYEVDRSRQMFHGTRPANDVLRGLAVVRGPTDPAGHVEAE